MASEIELVLLKDYCEEIQYGYTQSASKNKIGPKFLRITDIQNKFISWEDVPYCEITEELHKKYRLDNGDIVIARTGASTGTNAIYAKEMPDAVFASYLIRLKMKKELNPFYVYYYLQSNYYKDYISSVISGSAQPNANAQQLTDVLIPLFPINEQTAISDLLFSLDKKIELNKEMNKILENICQAIFKHWFVDFEFPDEDGKPYKSSGGEMVDSEIGKIPKAWKVLNSISELCAKINYGYTQSANTEKVGPKFLRVMDINKADWIDWSTVPYCEIDEKDKPKYLLAKKDIVIARMADPGKTTIFESDLPVVFASYLIRIRLKNPIFAYYLYYLMKSSYYQNFIEGAATGSVQKSLNAKALTVGLSIALPDNEIVFAFNSIVESMRAKINNNLLESAALSKIRDALLPKLMSGEIRVKVPESVSP